MLKHGEFPRTLFWGFYDGRDYKKFQATSDLLAYLKRRKELTLLHHTNFDAHVLLIDGAPLGIRRSYGNKLIECTLYHHKLLNTYCSFPESLGKIFEAFGKKKQGFFCADHERTPIENRDDEFNLSVEHCLACRKLLEKRNYEDCVWGYDCILGLNETFFSIAGVRPLGKGTIAGTSFAAAEMEAGEMPLDLEFSAAYRGGRVEVFDLNERTAARWDINSSYPYSVLACPDEDTLLDVAVNTKDFYAPFFLTGMDEYFLFPNGKFRTWVWQSNLDRILAAGSESKISIVGRYPKDLRWLAALKPVVQRVFNLKCSSDNKAEVKCCKFFLNSMYGRLGMRGGRERCRVFFERPRVTRDATVFEFKNLYLVFDTMHGKPKANFPFASYITCSARTRLYEQFRKTNAYYGDTDSVFCSTDHKPGPIGKALGEWSGGDVDTFQARNVKDYKFGMAEVLKGGKESIQWTLKQVAQANPPIVVSRNRVLPLQKRVMNSDGTTRPLTIDEIYDKFLDKPETRPECDLSQLSLGLKT